MYSIIKIINSNEVESKFNNSKNNYNLFLKLHNIKTNKVITLSCYNSFIPKENDIIEDNFEFDSVNNKYDNIEKYKTKKLIIKLPNIIDIQKERICEILDYNNSDIDEFNKFNFNYGDNLWLDIYNEYIKLNDFDDDINNQSINIINKLYIHLEKYIYSLINYFITNLKDKGLQLNNYNQYFQLLSHPKFGPNINLWDKQNIKDIIYIDGFGQLSILKLAKFLKCSISEKYELIIIFSLTIGDHSYIDFKYNKWKKYYYNNDKNDELQIDDHITKNNYKDIINNLISSNIIYNIDNKLYLTTIFNKEKTIVDILFKFNNKSIIKNNMYAYDHIFFSKKNNKNKQEDPKEYNPQQRAAIESILINNFIIIDGKAGTGKSSVIPGIVYVSNKYISDLKIYILTPTAKAKMRVQDIINEYLIFTNEIKIIEKKDGIYKFNNKNNNYDDIYFKNINNNIEYKTIKLFNLLFNHKNEEFKINFNNNNIIIIDEISMVNLEDLYILLINLNSVNNNIKIILSGDIRQLPSIGIGDIYNKIIKCKDKFCYNELTTLVRSNDALNGCVENILENKIPLSNEYFKWLKIKDDDIFDICSILPDDYNINNSIIITQTNSYISKYTINLRNKLNPLDTIKIKESTKNIKYLSDINIKASKYFRLNDPVIHTKNINKLKLYNGMIGKIIEIFEHFDEMKEISYTNVVVKFKNNFIYNYNINDNSIEHLEPAYMITVHKSQGQEYDNIYIYFNSEKMTTHNSLYTAITRGKRNVTLICSKNLLLHALNNPSIKNSMMNYMIYFYEIINNNYDNEYEYYELFKKYYEYFNNNSEIKYKNNIYDIDYKTLIIKHKDTTKTFGIYNIKTGKIIQKINKFT